MIHSVSGIYTLGYPNAIFDAFSLAGTPIQITIYVGISVCHPDFIMLSAVTHIAVTDQKRFWSMYFPLQKQG